MSLAAPLFLLLSVLALPLAAAFLVRRRAPRRRVSSVILLKAAAARASARRLLPKLREPLALILSLLALLALVVSLAGLSCGEGPTGRVVVVVESSARMARGEAEARFARARERVAQRVENLPRSTEVAVIEAADRAEVRRGLSSDRGAAIQAIRSVTPQGRGGGLGAALDLAHALCRDPERDAVFVLADGALSHELPRCASEVQALGGSGENVGIAELTARRGDGLGLLEVQVGIAADHARVVDLALRVDGRLADTARVETREGQTVWSLRRLDVDGERIEVSLVDHRDANPVDDRATVQLPRREPLVVGLITDRPEGFLAKALRLHPGVEVRLVDAEAAPTLEGLALGVVEVPADLPEAPHWIAFGEGAATSLGLTVGDSVERPQVIRWAFDDPRFAFVDLDEVQITSATLIVAPPGGEILVEAEAGPLMVSGARGEGRVTALGFRPSQTDLALRVDFLHLLANLIDAAAPSGAQVATSSAVGAPDVLPPMEPAQTTLTSQVAAGGPSLVEVLVALGLLALLLETVLSAAAGHWRRRRA
ncbi:MAG: VWA domain-containing protein [Deltaproteobacteria bacterium]|nr:MAG: VWA domain-containing protein [Deltaproteobacteria bacterium]